MFSLTVCFTSSSSCRSSSRCSSSPCCYSSISGCSSLRCAFTSSCFSFSISSISCFMSLVSSVPAPQRTCDASWVPSHTNDGSCFRCSSWLCGGSTPCFCSGSCSGSCPCCCPAHVLLSSPILLYSPQGFARPLDAALCLVCSKCVHIYL